MDAVAFFLLIGDATKHIKRIFKKVTTIACRMGLLIAFDRFLVRLACSLVQAERHDFPASEQVAF
ncbi:hypothetical protein AL504_05670 [Achromobacter xylosoxidans]|uniref:Uncharacterized protein n=1 Tax=Alcaligenes xylosoxydans xylosoxydans TaxID=85698 RepID=A0A0X8NWC6_ALCXX|nr:hypothetical protein AL504_05670 [Achromobacter xylosoxidans]